MATLREIDAGTPAFERFIAALQQADLPIADLTAEPFRYFSVDDLAWGGVGSGPNALIRSVVVLPEARKRGLGVVVTESLVQHARENRVERLWLLTTSAAPFFERLGWRVADRSTAPAAIAQSRQFSDLCPASAALMVRSL